MEKLVRIFFWVSVSSLLLISCSSKQNNFKEMIGYVLKDSTLSQNLFYEGHPDDEFKVKSGKFSYSVHPYLTSNILGMENLTCLSRLGVSEDIITTLNSSPNIKSANLKNYSTSDTSIVHFFFTKRIQNVRGVSVFSRNYELYGYKQTYSKPLDYIWDFNYGVVYWFVFDKKNQTISKVCKDKILAE